MACASIAKRQCRDIFDEHLDDFITTATKSERLQEDDLTWILPREDRQLFNLLPVSYRAKAVSPTEVHIVMVACNGKIIDEELAIRLMWHETQFADEIKRAILTAVPFERVFLEVRPMTGDRKKAFKFALVDAGDRLSDKACLSKMRNYAEEHAGPDVLLRGPTTPARACAHVKQYVQTIDKREMWDFWSGVGKAVWYGIEDLRKGEKLFMSLHSMEESSLKAVPWMHVRLEKKQLKNPVSQLVTGN